MEEIKVFLAFMLCLLCVCKVVTNTTEVNILCNFMDGNCSIDSDCCSEHCKQNICVNSDADHVCNNSVCKSDEECYLDEKTSIKTCRKTSSTYTTFCPPGQEPIPVSSCSINDCQEYQMCKLKEDPCSDIKCKEYESCYLKLILPDCLDSKCLPIATCLSPNPCLNHTCQEGSTCINSPESSCNMSYGSALCAPVPICQNEMVVNPCSTVTCSTGSGCYVLRPLADETDCENGNGCSLINATPICMTIDPCSLFQCSRTKPYCYVVQKCADKLCPPAAKCTANATEAAIGKQEHNY